MKKDEVDFSSAEQGPVVKAPNKTRITIRLDADVVDWFRSAVHKAGGGNYQTLINDALRDHIANKDGRLEDTLRTVIREELEKYSTDERD
ncbi:BrnA antitoxin family protein [Escherichia coli]|nr:BrnA antitoxin family protein [Escherichia coli]